MSDAGLSADVLALLQIAQTVDVEDTGLDFMLAAQQYIAPPSSIDVIDQQTGKRSRKRLKRGSNEWLDKRAQEAHEQYVERLAEHGDVEPEFYCPPDEVAGDPPKYHGGLFRLKPIESCERAALAAQERCGTDGRQFRVYCLTCQEDLGPAEIELSEPGAIVREVWIRSTLGMFGLASDHAREWFNHAVVVEHVETGLPIWKAPYDIKATVATAGYASTLVKTAKLETAA